MFSDAQKCRARKMIAVGIQAGRIEPPSSCEDCGKHVPKAKNGRRQIQGHHHKGYSFPLDVKWLCPKCHCAHDKRPRGYANGRAKLTDEAVMEIRNTPLSQGALLAAKFGVSLTTISHARLGRVFPHLPGAHDAQPRDGSATHCPHGHEYTEQNSKIDNRGWRSCRACHRKRDMNRYFARRSILTETQERE